jgi:hypothetical protein
VIPSRTGVGGSLASSIGNQLRFELFKSIRSTCSPEKNSRVAWIGDLDLLQHLTNDHLDVLVVDGHALQAIDLLDFVDEIGRKRFHALDRQNVVRCRVAVDQVLTLFNGIAFLKVEVLAFRDEVFDGLGALFCGWIDDDRRLFL